MVVESRCLTPSLATDDPPKSLPASLVSENVNFHHPTQCSVINLQDLKGREDDSNLRGSFVRTDISGYKYSTQITTPHQVISIDARPALQPIPLLNLPPELMTRILLYLSPFDIISCRRTCRTLYDLCSDAIFRYLVQMERSGVSDDMSPGLSYSQRLCILEKREEAWGMLNFHRSVNIPIPFNWFDHWSFTGGALLLSTEFDLENRRSSVGYSYVTLPSLSDAQDQKFEWKRQSFESALVITELAMYEQDMIVALIA